MTADIDPIRRRHNDFVSSHPCSTDTCDTRLVLDTLDETMADRDERASRHVDSEYDLVTRLAAARVHADRLAEALRALTDECYTMGYHAETPEMMGIHEMARDALRQHGGVGDIGEDMERIVVGRVPPFEDAT
jgi:hypothetical protein